VDVAVVSVICTREDLLAILDEAAKTAMSVESLPPPTN
jgi:hypothetical protein